MMTPLMYDDPLTSPFTFYMRFIFSFFSEISGQLWNKTFVTNCHGPQRINRICLSKPLTSRTTSRSRLPFVQWNISMSNKWIAVTFCKHIHVLHRMNWSSGISPYLQNVSPWNLIQTFMVPRRSILITLVNPWLFPFIFCRGFTFWFLCETSEQLQHVTLDTDNHGAQRIHFNYLSKSQSLHLAPSSGQGVPQLSWCLNVMILPLSSL